MGEAAVKAWLGLLIVGCAPEDQGAFGVRVGDGVLSLDFDGTLEPTTQRGLRVEEELVLDGESIGPFVLTAVSAAERLDDALGRALRTTLHGEAKASDGAVVQETLTVDFFESHPGAAVLQRTYATEAEKAYALDAMVVARVRITSAAYEAEPLRLSVGPAADIAYKDEEYLSIPVVAGYRKSGDMLQGGVPMVDVWSPTGGFALGHIEPRNEAVALPIEAFDDNDVEIALTQAPRAELGEVDVLDAEHPAESVRVVLIEHRGDFFDPLARLSAMVSVQLDRPIVQVDTPDATYEPYWKTWGLPNKVEWTKEEVLAAAAELRKVGIDWIELDYGWFETEGRWMPSAKKFKDEADFVDFIETLHDMGFRVGLWWSPLQLDPELKDDALSAGVVVDEDGDLVVDDDDTYNLSPSDAAVQDFVRATARQLISYGADHLYLDSQETQLFARPDFEPAHTGDAGPLASFRALPDIYRIVREEADTADREVIVETCPDGRPHSLLHMPYVQLENNGDPGSDRQVREETKWLKALRGPTSAVGDGYLGPYNDSNTTGDPANSLGVGAQLTTLRTVPSTLTAKAWAAWIARYRKLGLSSGEVLNLYNIAFDHPEGHVIRKGEVLYYAFFVRSDPVRLCLSPCDNDEDVPTAVESAEDPFVGSIPLRGLVPGQAYNVTDYEHGTQLATVAANEQGEATIDTAFDRRLLLQATLTSGGKK